MMRTPAIMIVLLTCITLACAQQQIGVNLVPNPGFEEPMEAEVGGGDTLEWSKHVGKGQVEFDIVTDNPHSGDRCAYINAKAPNPSGYWISPRIEVEGGKRYVFRCWIRTEDVLPSNRGLTFSMNFRREDGSACGWPKTSAEPFTHPWTQIEFRGTAAHDAAHVNLVMGLADSPGKMWIDDVYFANTGETREDVIDTDEIIARPFPQTWLPDDQSIGLIQGQVQPLLFLVQNRQQKQVANPAIGLLLPDGVEVIGGDRSVEPGKPGEIVEVDGEEYTRWLQPVEGNRHMEKNFNYYRGVLVALRTVLAPGEYQAYSFFHCDQESEEPHPLTLTVLDPLPEAPELERFHIGALLTDAYRGGGEVLQGLAEMYADTGMNVATYGVSPDPTALGRHFKQRGVLRHFLMPGQGVVYNVSYGNRDPDIAITDAQGEPDFGGLCPTYIATRGEHFEQDCLEDIVAEWIRADAMDGFAINWEPPGKYRLDGYCWDDRCLEAFSEHSGIPLDELKDLGPARILEEYKLQWARFRAETEGLIAKTYFDTIRELEEETGRHLMWYPWTGPRRFEPPNPTQGDTDEAILTGDVEHPWYYRNYIDAYGPFTYAYYDVLAEQWRGRHAATLDSTNTVAEFAQANPRDGETVPVWLGIEGIQKGSHSTLCWATTPEQMEVEIMGGLAQGAEGIYVYTARGMDGHFYTAMARAVRRAALLEKYIDDPVEADRSTLADPTGNMPEEYVDFVARHWLFGSRDSLLLVLAGLDFTREYDLKWSLRGIQAGEYRISDPVTGEALGDGTFSAQELVAGVPVTLGPGDLGTYVIERE